VFCEVRWGTFLPVLQASLGHFASYSPNNIALSTFQRILLRTNPAFDTASYKGQASEMGAST
jgi:hypothetical protein